MEPPRIVSCEIDAAQESAWLAQRLSAPVPGLDVLVVRYREPALVLGRAQAVRWDREQLQRQTGLPVVVRASGGGAVLVGPWLVSVSVVVPAGHALARLGLHGAYRWFGRLHERVMDLCGLQVVARAPDTLPARRAHDPLDGVCFAAVSPWEVTAGELKLCGLAQVRRAQAVALVAGTHLARPPWELLAQPFGCPDVGRLMDERAVDMARLGSTVTAAQLAGLWVEQMAIEGKDEEHETTT